MSCLLLVTGVTVAAMEAANQPNPNPRCHDPSAHDAHPHVPGMRVPNRTPAGDMSCSKANPLITAADVAATTAVGSWWAVSEANGQVRGVDRILLLPQSGCSPNSLTTGDGYLSGEHPQVKPCGSRLG